MKRRQLLGLVGLASVASLLGCEKDISSVEVFDPSDLGDLLQKCDLKRDGIPDVSYNGNGYPSWYGISDISWLKPGMIGPYDMTRYDEQTIIKALNNPNPTQQEIVEAQSQLSEWKTLRKIYEATKKRYSAYFDNHPDNLIYIFGFSDKIVNESYWRPIAFTKTDSSGKIDFYFSTYARSVSISELAGVNPIDKSYKVLEGE